MKITIKKFFCKWRGQELPPLVENLSPFLTSGSFDIVFGCSIYAENRSYEALISNITDESSSEIILYYPNILQGEIIADYTVNQLLHYLVSDGFAEVVYIFDKSERFLVYSNSRDTFSFWIIPKGVLAKRELESWDGTFQEHLRTVGIGFGDDGRAYAKHLLAGLMRSDPRTKARFSPVLRTLG